MSWERKGKEDNEESELESLLTLCDKLALTMMQFSFVKAESTRKWNSFAHTTNTRCGGLDWAAAINISCVALCSWGVWVFKLQWEFTFFELKHHGWGFLLCFSLLDWRLEKYNFRFGVLFFWFNESERACAVFFVSFWWPIIYTGAKWCGRGRLEEEGTCVCFARRDSHLLISTGSSAEQKRGKEEKKQRHVVNHCAKITVISFAHIFRATNEHKT